MNEQASRAPTFQLQALCESALDTGRSLKAELAKQDARLSKMLDDALACICAKEEGAKRSGYRQLPPAIERLIGASSATTPNPARLAKRALLALSFTHPRDLRTVALPDSILPLYVRELRRILEAIRDEGRDIDLAEDRWRKNLAILDGRLIPVGAEFADVGSGLPRNTLLRDSVATRLRVLRCVMTQTHGFKPMLELHAHPDSLDDFNPAGWLQSYKRLAEILAINPEYKGVIASSWFRDPILTRISPRLSYLREYPESYGALMVRLGEDRDGSSGALARSPTRRSLFEQGGYVPVIYLMIWPREKMLAWARGLGETID